MIDFNTYVVGTRLQFVKYNRSTFLQLAAMNLAVSTVRSSHPVKSISRTVRRHFGIPARTLLALGLHGAAQQD